MKKEQTYIVDAPTFLLKFLLHKVSRLSRNNVKHLLSRGRILVDGTCQRQFDLPLQPGQQVTILPQTAGVELPFPILYEDQRLIVVDKPAGLLTVGTEQERVRTAYRITADYLRSRSGIPRLFILHRLDRDTSGVLAFAKDGAFRDMLQENWNHLVSKRGYYAIVEDGDLPQEGVCRSQLRESRSHRVYSSPHGQGQDAVTRYRTLDHRRGYALLDVEIETGRKNQIRVHLSELGHPVAGDKKYGAHSNPIGRLALHAYQLTFTSPDDGQEYSFTSPLPKEFRKMFPRSFV